MINSCPQIIQIQTHYPLNETNTDAPGGNKVKLWQKSPKSYISTLPHPQGHVISVKCEQPLDELTVKVWLLYDHPNLNIALSL